MTFGDRQRWPIQRPCTFCSTDCCVVWRWPSVGGASTRHRHGWDAYSPNSYPWRRLGYYWSRTCNTISICISHGIGKHSTCMRYPAKNVRPFIRTMNTISSIFGLFQLQFPRTIHPRRPDSVLYILFQDFHRRRIDSTDDGHVTCPLKESLRSPNE